MSGLFFPEVWKLHNDQNFALTYHRLHNRRPRGHYFNFFSLQFSYEHSEISPSFLFFMSYCISRTMNAKKKTRNSRGKSKAMETHFYPIEFFFISLDFSCELSERFPTFFLCPVSFSRIMNAKKKLEIREGRQDQWNTTSTPCFFFFFH